VGSWEFLNSANVPTQAIGCQKEKKITNILEGYALTMRIIQYSYYFASVTSQLNSGRQL
jgi:hypothetical protein